MTKSPSDDPFAPVDAILADENLDADAFGFKEIEVELEKLKCYVDALESQLTRGIVDAFRKAVWG